jgi:hypothetical protein
MDATYLCGGMEHLTDEQMRGWRTVATEQLKLRGITTLDPTRRAPLHLIGVERTRNLARRIVKADLQDIAHSRVILADLRDSSKGGRRWGSIAEIAHGHTKNKIIIVLLDKEQDVHPFVDFYATEIVHTLEEGIDAVEEYYR